MGIHILGTNHRLMLKISNGLKQLHDRNIIHSDIKVILFIQKKASNIIQS
jgi:serine/threonine protein kinase